MYVTENIKSELYHHQLILIETLQPCIPLFSVLYSTWTQTNEQQKSGTRV